MRSGWPLTRVMLGLSVVGSVLLASCHARRDARTAKQGISDLSAQALGRQLRAIDSIETELRNGPGGAKRRETMTASAGGATPADRLAQPMRATDDELALPDSSSAYSGASIRTAPSYAQLRRTTVMAVPPQRSIAVSPIVLPVEAFTPVWALAPVAGATFVSGATVQGETVVPEPSTVWLLATGLCALVPVLLRRSRR